MSVDRGRRRFLRWSIGAGLGLGATSPLMRVMAATPERVRRASDPLPLAPAVDAATGLPLIELPEGFRYTSLSWFGDEMGDGRRVPSRHDGMAVVAQRDGDLLIVRNHEIVSTEGSFAAAEHTFDPVAGGGTTTLRVDPEDARLVDSWASLSGTDFNCSGGPTPWGTWLSCEEKAHGPEHGFRREHGWVFEVPPDGSDAEPIEAMGRFLHEAAAVDPADGTVYLTEDRPGVSGLYRYLPDHPGELASGGRLQMARAGDGDDLRGVLPQGYAAEVSWVEIEEPRRLHTRRGGDHAGVLQQGLLQRASRFTRLEGCWFERGALHLSSTDGGHGQGQIFRFTPATSVLELVYQSPSASVMERPDNLCASPGGGLMICEDGSGRQLLHAIDIEGRLAPFALNNVVLDGERNRLSGDFRGSEWAGVHFSPDGVWMFVNIQTPGITLAITGPWSELGL